MSLGFNIPESKTIQLTGIIQKIKGNGKFYKNPEMALNKDSQSNHQFILAYFAYLCSSEREKK